MPGSNIITLSCGIPPKFQIEVIRRHTKKYKTYLCVDWKNTISYQPSMMIRKHNFAQILPNDWHVSGSIDKDPHGNNGRPAVVKKGYFAYV
mmetsp:Transcript_59410/g.66486  ORF Transcript_59410/g.66486 Transcript_59410/m.66486 type:complete len:91 (-) Transcript_59410:36-308(-)